MSQRTVTKDKRKFGSARWEKDYNPDFCSITTDNRGLPLHCSRQVLSQFPNRPILVNFQKAIWKIFSQEVHHNKHWISPKPKWNDRFDELIYSIAKKHIPGNFRKEHILDGVENAKSSSKSFRPLKALK